MTTTSAQAGESADPATAVTVSFFTDFDPTTVDDRALVVHGQITGVYAGTVSQPSADSVRFVPRQAFKPGETIAVTVSPR